MQIDDGRPGLEYRGRVSAQMKSVVLKAATVVVGLAALASAFVVSVAFFAVGIAVTVVLGGYLWWKTRHLRRQLRAELQGRPPARTARGDVIEGEVLSRSESDANEPRSR